MSRCIARRCAAAAVLLAGSVLSGCTNQVYLSPDFGQAFRQDAVAQIADPDARYAGTPKPGGSGERAALAERRYATGEVIPPASTSTSTVSAGGGGGGGGGGSPPAQ